MCHHVVNRKRNHSRNSSYTLQNKGDTQWQISENSLKLHLKQGRGTSCKAGKKLHLQSISTLTHEWSCSASCLRSAGRHRTRVSWGVFRTPARSSRDDVDVLMRVAHWWYPDSCRCSWGRGEQLSGTRRIRQSTSTKWDWGLTPQVGKNIKNSELSDVFPSFVGEY